MLGRPHARRSGRVTLTHDGDAGWPLDTNPAQPGNPCGYGARVHDELAVRRAGDSAAYQRIADEARRAALRARDIERRYTGLNLPARHAHP